MRPWKTLSRRTILSCSKFLAVESHTVELPDGRVVSEWPWVVTPDYVNVAAVTEDGEFLCFRQTKYSVEGTSLAPVGGYLEPGEDPLTAAQRELLEETGYEAAHMVPLGVLFASPSAATHRAHVFLATGLHQVGEQRLDANESIIVEKIDLAAAVQAAAHNRLFQDLGTTAALLMAWHRLHEDAQLRPA